MNIKVLLQIIKVLSPLFLWGKGYLDGSRKEKTKQLKQDLKDIAKEQEIRKSNTGISNNDYRKWVLSKQSKQNKK